MSGTALSLDEREEIRLGIDREESFCDIAVSLGCSPSTISREVARGGGRAHYRAAARQRCAVISRMRPRSTKLWADPVLSGVVRVELHKGFSPAACAKRLERAGGRTVCTETIYRAVYAGTLGVDAAECLRTKRPRRRRRKVKTKTTHTLGSFIKIADRPASVLDRKEGGHWEGDLIIGAKNASAVVTLVERTSRFTLLGNLPSGYRPVDTLACLAELFDSVPAAMRRSLTWDRGSEMAQWPHLVEWFNMGVYFADAHSPWQRGTNENTNRQLRFWLPKGTRLDDVSNEELAEITDVLNHQPRRLLGWDTSAERYAAASSCVDG